MGKKITIVSGVLVLGVISIIAGTQTGMIKKGGKTVSARKNEYQTAPQTGAATSTGGVVVDSTSGGSATAGGDAVIYDPTPIGELTRFENDLKLILDGLQGLTGAVIVKSPDIPQNDWNKMIEKHKQSGAEVIVHPSGATSPNNQYIQTKQRVEKTLKATLEALNKEFKK